MNAITFADAGLIYEHLIGYTAPAIVVNDKVVVDPLVGTKDTDCAVGLRNAVTEPVYPAVVIGNAIEYESAIIFLRYIYV